MDGLTEFIKPECRAAEGGVGEEAAEAGRDRVRKDLEGTHLSWIQWVTGRL